MPFSFPPFYHFLLFFLSVRPYPKNTPAKLDPNLKHQVIPKDPLSSHAFSEATKLASERTEYAHLVKLMNPEHALRLKCFVQDLPDDIANATDYGRAVKKLIPLTAAQRRALKGDK